MRRAGDGPGGGNRFCDSDPDPRAIATIRTLCIDAVGWERYVGDEGRVIGMKTFGASAPLKELQKRYGFEPGRVVAAVKELLGKG